MNLKKPLAEASITCLDCDATISERNMTQVAVSALAAGWCLEQRSVGGRYDRHWVCPKHRAVRR